MSRHSVSRRVFLGAAALGATFLANPTYAFAEPTSSEKMAEANAQRVRLDAMQHTLEAASDAYYKASGEYDDAVKAIDAAQSRIDEATSRIEKLQSRLSSRARGMYRDGGTSFLDILLGSASFEEFSTTWDTLDMLNENDAEMVRQVKDLRAEIKQEKIDLETQEKIAQEKLEEASRIKKEAEETVSQMQALLDTLDAEARELLEKEQAQARETASADTAAAAMRELIASLGNNGFTGGDGGSSHSEVCALAISKIGCPYVWAAEGPSSFDCSGLVTWAYRQIGIPITHQTESQFTEAKWRGPVSEALPGDVLYRPGHVGIALSPGGTHYVHAPTFGAHVRDTDALSWASFTHALRF